MRRFSVILVFCSFLVFGAVDYPEQLMAENHYEDSGSVKGDSLNVRFVGNWPFGLSYAVAYDSLRSLAFCGSGGGVYILNVSDPSSPVKVSEGIHTRSLVYGLFYDASSERVYIADGDAGLEIWDVSTPSSPVKLGFYDTPDQAHGVAVSGTYAYVADGSSGLRVIDISDPSNPFEVGYYDTPYSGNNVAVSGAYAYVADGRSGLQIYENLLFGIGDSQDEISLPVFRLSQNPVVCDYIEIELSVEQKDGYDLNLYNLLGQKVKTFTISGLSAGKHKIRLETKGLTGGVYFLRMGDKESQQCVKVTIMK